MGLVSFLVDSSALWTINLNQNNRQQTPLLRNCCVCPSFGLLRGAKMCYCTRVFWPKVQPHGSCCEQNPELSDCWQTAAVRGCRFLTHGWHRAPTGGSLWASPRALMWSPSPSLRDSTFRLCYLPQEGKEAGGDQFTLMCSISVGIIVAPFNPLIQEWPLQTWRRSAAQLMGIFLWRLTGGDVGVSRQVWEWCRRGSGDLSFFPSRDRLPVSVTAHQAQSLCAGETSTWQTDVILELSGLSFRLCAATYTHVSS